MLKLGILNGAVSSLSAQLSHISFSNAPLMKAPWPPCRRWRRSLRAAL